MRNQLANGILEISGKDLNDLSLVTDEYDVAELATMAARRMLQTKNRRAGMGFAKARAESMPAKPTGSMLDAVRAALGRGCNSQQAISAAIMAAYLEKIEG